MDKHFPYIQLGATSDLGKAVAELTGIKPLEDVARHAAKTKTKLQKDLVKDRESGIEKIDDAFIKVRMELASLIEAHPDISPDISLPSPGPATTIEGELETLKQHFESLQTTALEEARSILGDSFDSSDPVQRKDLMDNVGPALGQLDTENLKRLPSENRLNNLASLTSDELSQVEATIQQFADEAKELEDLAANPDVHARLRLYARVAGWIKDLPERPESLVDCPVCQSVLQGKTDELTGKAISEHIQQHLETDSDYLEKTLSAWEQNAVAGLTKELPSQLNSEISKDLPENPINLIYSAFGEELFESTVFKSSLAPLQSLCRAELDALPSFEEPTAVALPKSFQKENSQLKKAIGRITRAIAFARWRQEHSNVCKETFGRIVGQMKSSQEGADIGSTPLESWSLSQRLNTLDRMVKSTTPITEALAKVNTMNDKISDRRKEENRIALYRRAEVAIEDLLGLRGLVECQVTVLMQKLLSVTLQWKRDFYIPAFSGAPEIVDADVTTNGGLSIGAAANGTKASAHHISNASDLRATLLAFLVAFWEYLLEEYGGLSLLLLDDLQELFDRQNRRRVANSVPSLMSSGGKIIVTTNDLTFGRQVMAASKKAFGLEKIERRRIHPLKAVRHHIELGQFVETIEEKRRNFERPENQNESQPAKDYIKDLRTLSDLICGLRNRQNNNSEPFSGPVFATLLSDPAIADNSKFLSLMNLSHHGEEDQITFNEVLQEKEACFRLRKLVDAAHEEYERWMRRDPRKADTASEVADLPDPIVPPHFSVPLITDLAAFTTDQPISEVIQSRSDELFSSDWLNNHAIYVINTDNLGFAGSRNYRAIVDLAEEMPKDNDLVIALHHDKVYARRLLYDSNNPDVVTLGSEAVNPLHRLRSLTLPINEVRLLKIVGILFDDQPHYPRPSGEAALVNDTRLLQKVELVFHITGDSALPLALDKQVILGGNNVMPSQLAEMEGQLVAVATSEGTVFKRVSKTIPGVPHVRQFESIGGLGESMLIRTEDLEGSLDNLPLLLSARHVLGVLYGPT